MDDKGTVNSESDGKSRWQPLPMDLLLKHYTTHRIWVWVLFVGWLLLLAGSIISTYVSVQEGWALAEIDQQRLFLFFFISPVVILGTLLVFWLGFEWGFIPLFLSAFLMAFFSAIPAQWALLFGIAYVLGLSIYGITYYCVPVDPALRDLKSFTFFTVVSFIASIASSLGSFVWSLYHGMPAAQAITLWEAWWTGTFLQSMLVIAPLLIFFTPVIERAKSGAFSFSRPKVSIAWIYSAIFSVVAVLVVFIVSAKMLGTAGIEESLSEMPTSAANDVLKVNESYEIVSWISIAIILSAGLGGIYLVGSWNKSLVEQVRNRTTQLRESEANLRVTLEERDLLLKKIHQRVNNNLTMVLSLLELQSKGNGDKRLSEVLKDAHGRLHSVAVIYETMHQTGSVNNVNMKNYAIKLANRLIQENRRARRQIEVSVNAEEIEMSIERAVPFGLIINELLVNAYVHGFKGMNQGTIFIELKWKKDDIVLSVRDNGHGLPDNFNVSGQDSLGLKLVQLLSRQLAGGFEVHNQTKPNFLVTIPIDESDNRKQPEVYEDSPTEEEIPV